MNRKLQNILANLEKGNKNRQLNDKFTDDFINDETELRTRINENSSLDFQTGLKNEIIQKMSRLLKLKVNEDNKE